MRSGPGWKELMSRTRSYLAGKKWKRDAFPGFIAGLLILFLVAPALSQDSGHVPPAQPMPRRNKRATVDDQVRALARNLNLDQRQQAEVKTVLERRQQEILRIMREGSGPDGIDRWRALQIETTEHIRSALNDEQKKKYSALAPRPPQTSAQPSVEDWMKATRPH